MSERLILQGALQEKKMERMKLAVKAEGLIRAMKTIIQFSSVTPLGELKTGEALEIIKDLHKTKSRYDALTGEMNEIKRELNIHED
jgi:uncharacterized protein (DUF2249 family)